MARKVVRDFSQLVGVLFSTFRSLAASAANPFGYIFTLANFDLNYTIPSFNAAVVITILIVVAMVFVLVFLWLECQVRCMHKVDAIRDGLEVELWDEKRDKNKQWTRFLQYSVVALTTLYLPLSQAAAEVW